jgi:hypothetical protein
MYGSAVNIDGRCSVIVMVGVFVIEAFNNSYLAGSKPSIAIRYSSFVCCHNIENL